MRAARRPVPGEPRPAGQPRAAHIAAWQTKPSPHPQRLRGAAGLIGGAIGRGAESVGEMMKDPVLRRKGAQALSK